MCLLTIRTHLKKSNPAKMPRQSLKHLRGVGTLMALWGRWLSLDAHRFDRFLVASDGLTHFR